MALDFTGKKLRDTYQRVVQVQGTILYDGLGNPIIDLSTITGGGGGGLTITNFVSKEHIIPNGILSSFSLAFTPIAGTEHVFINGLLTNESDDYTISGPTLTFITAPHVADKILVTYFK